MAEHFLRDLERDALRKHRCASGHRHGPYAYLFWREGGRLRKRYLPRRVAELARLASLAERSQKADARARRREALEHWRRLSWAVVGIDHDGA